MEKEYEVLYVAEPDQAVWKAIGGGIHDYNKQQVGKNDYEQLCFCLYGPDETIVGGIIGATYWDWLYVDLLWVKRDLRGCGYGHQLLTVAEDKARQRGAKHAYLDTFSFQVPAFYEQRGYVVFGELQDFPPGHQRFFMKKQL